MELAASARLFGGREALRARVQHEARDRGVERLAWAPNALAALALLRTGQADAGAQVLEAVLDAMPVSVLGAARPHAQVLGQSGCRTLGALRQLPRGALGRRFDQALLHALDQLYGHAPQAHEWQSVPEAFEVRLELPSRVDDAEALMVGARRLMQQLLDWLFARRSGVLAFTLRWAHDAMRSREVGPLDELSVRTAEPTRDGDHLCRLLAEHLAHVQLQAPVGELWLLADEVRPLVERSDSLLPDTVRPGEALPRVLERIAARLGADRVLRPVLVADHRPEAMCRWQPADQPLPRQPDAVSETPQPTFLLAEPLRLAVRAHRPIYLGELRLLLGPQRVEGGWWDRDDAQGLTRRVARDYWLASSEHAGLLWVFQTRAADGGEPAWYLHGVFA
ncbi:MAG: DNA polymerase Y family protein [Hydrogenophaga sp.]|nr:DNA polymerase Y family protein [Hydrogenophaga sp.]